MSKPKPTDDRLPTIPIAFGRKALHRVAACLAQLQPRQVGNDPHKRELRRLLALAGQHTAEAAAALDEAALLLLGGPSMYQARRLASK